MPGLPRASSQSTIVRMPRNKPPKRPFATGVPKPVESIRVEPALPRQSARPVNLPSDFNALYAAASQDFHEWAAVDGNSSSQEAMQRWLHDHWKEVLTALGVEEERGADAQAELIEAELLYRCLRSSVDRAPMFDAIRSDLLDMEQRIDAALQALDEEEAGGWSGRQERIGPYSDGAYSREFMSAIGVLSAPLVIDGAVLSRLFEIKARQLLEATKRRIERLLAPTSNLDVMPSTRSGRRWKYSKDFLILRCACIYEKYGSHKRRAGVTGKKASKSRSRLEPIYVTTFVAFVRKVLEVVDPEASSDSPNGLGKTVREALALRKVDSEVDCLVHSGSTFDELQRFMAVCRLPSAGTRAATAS